MTSLTITALPSTILWTEYRSREWDQGLTAAIRVYIVKFYRTKMALTDEK